MNFLQSNECHFFRWISGAWACCTVLVPVSKLGPPAQELKKSNELLMRSEVIMKLFRAMLHQFIEFLAMGRDRVSERKSTITSKPRTMAVSEATRLPPKHQRGIGNVSVVSLSIFKTVRYSNFRHFLLGPVLEKVLQFGNKRRIYLC